MTKKPQITDIDLKSLSYESYPESAVKPQPKPAKNVPIERRRGPGKPEKLTDKYPQFKPVQPSVMVQPGHPQADAPEGLSGAAQAFLQEGQQPQYEQPTYIHHAPVQSLGVQRPNSEAEALSIELPSRFAMYEFKDLFASPIRAYHMAKMARAHSEKSLRLMAECVSSMLHTSDERFENVSLAHQLTLPDFYYVLYFQRLTNYNKTRYLHTEQCSNPEHIAMVKEGKLKKESLKITELITSSMLKTTMLDQMPVIDEELMDGIRVRPATVQDSIDWLEDERFANEEFQFLGQIACYLEGETFSQKIDLASSLTPDQVQAVMDYEKALFGYGVEETITIRCKECGASMKTPVNIDASAFLPR